MKTALEIEKQMSGIYPISIFFIFQIEVVLNLYCNIKLVDESVNKLTYHSWKCGSNTKYTLEVIAISPMTATFLLCLDTLLLCIFAVRKEIMPASLDIGDKSVYMQEGQP